MHGKNICSEVEIVNSANNMEGYNKTDVTESVIKWERRNNEYDTFDHLIDGRHDEDEVIMEKRDEAVKENKCPVNVVSKSFEGKADNKTCKECGKVFLYPKDLKKHMLVHSKVFPFSCKMCSKGIGMGIPTAAVPIITVLLPTHLYYLPNIMNVLHGSLLEVPLSFTDICFLGF